MKLKSSVALMGLKPETMVAWMAAYHIITHVHEAPMVVTSVCDSKHGVPFSSHYDGRAFDIRIKDPVSGRWIIPQEEQEEVVEEMREALTSDFYIQLESDHIHVQFKVRYRA